MNIVRLSDISITEEALHDWLEAHDISFMENVGLAVRHERAACPFERVVGDNAEGLELHGYFFTSEADAAAFLAEFGGAS